MDSLQHRIDLENKARALVSGIALAESEQKRMILELNHTFDALIKNQAERESQLPQDLLKVYSGLKAKIG